MSATKITNTLKELEKAYHPNESIAAELGKRSLVMVVGPAGVGKSAIISHIAERDARFAQVRGITTRPPRPDDEPNAYRYIPHTEPYLQTWLISVLQRELVQYAVHPTTKRLYGSELADFPGTYNCNDTMASGVDLMRRLPFASQHTYSIVTSPNNWLARFHARYTPESAEYYERLAEASISLEWSLNDPETIWVRNNDGELGGACDNVIAYTTGEKQPDMHEQEELRALGKAMLESASSARL